LEANGLAEPGSGIDQKNAEPVVILGLGSDGGEKAVFFIVLQESYPPLDFFLPLEFG
jgi:hypothetical protein